MALKQIHDAYRISAEDVCSQLQTDPVNGLSKQEAIRRLSIFGENRLEKSRRKSFFRIFN